MRVPLLTRRQALMAALAAGVAAPALARATRPALRVGAILPLAGRGLPLVGVNLSFPAEAARKGLLITSDDLERATPMGTEPHRLLLANAPEAASARRAAERLVERDRATVLIGGFSAKDARAIGAVARDAGALFINIAAPADGLRAEFCGGRTLHLEAPASTYLSALSELYRGQGRNRWHLIHQDDSAHVDLLAQAQADLRRAGAEVTGTSIVSRDSTLFRSALSDLQDSGAEAVLLLTDWLVQLNLLATAEGEGATVPITGFPWAATQTREFYNRCRQLAPNVGGAPRLALWEARLDTAEAAALNADFLARWRIPMDPSAWAAQTALRLVAEATEATGSTSGTDLAAWLSDPVQRPSIGKDTVFNPSDGQLRQPLYAVRVNPAATKELTPQAITEWAELLAQLNPAPAPTGKCGSPAQSG
ncbi:MULTISPECIES: ABC transporter substrate-binding protein [unclassified Paracoccus (in: a-proteobacteria)]|uniref:ABC transporter substrate-binding protein n=1 Tax=unclassified Paracoccus (in: a-proteobacteria) TaxID=2688777 RepID=UPI00160275D5|nr:MULTISPECIES: ABC transporter substrate-binding protein [unclassified Paracoccus (in: a-proteobacteria)]MBB1493004.1 ABC transporter substrate-binding protein [Paracoccus sp. MC1854]MBB1499550.1 ABC transporter substrate-binding protein [Paracoccus sp. MC1862]QQO45131.1 ABC transporter substrate-binding protein [Paracoccus sp. MC1862]